jgi:phage terminase small subunit
MPKASRDVMATKKAREKSVVTKQQEIIEKQQAFADAIVCGSSQADAARAAGYHPGSASSVMRQEEIQLMVANAKAEMRELSTIKKLDVLEIFIEAIDMARTLADPAQMINGAREVGRMMGFYEPETLKLEVSGNTAAMASKFKALTDSELLEIAAGRAKVIDGEVVQ